MIIRQDYLDKLISWKHENIIKVVTGIRRCGKSYLLKMYQDYLLEINVTKDQLIIINFEELENEELYNYKALHDYLLSKLNKDKMTYIFLDEIQKVEGFEKVVDSIYVKDNVDLYITGSNSHLLSGELATLLSGRYIEIKMLPLSFAEYYSLYSDRDKDTVFSEYMINGSFPFVATMDRTEEKVKTYLEGLYNTVIIKDIEERNNRKFTDPNKRKVNDITLLKKISKFLAGNIGNLLSVKRVTYYITSSGTKVSQNTVNDYIESLEQSFMFYSAERYDIQGMQLLKNNKKMYIVDIGLRRFLISKKEYDLGFSLENVIYLELLRRGFSVNVGKAGVSEVDFVVRKNDNLEYFQVTASLLDEKTFDREISPLKAIKDHYPKTIITLDRFTLGNYDGIQVVNAVDWLLNS